MKIVGQAIMLGAWMTALINVTCDENVTLTCSLGDKVYTAYAPKGSHQFKVHQLGAWTITAIDGEWRKSTEVLVYDDKQEVDVELYLANVYGISRVYNASSPVWARTDDAVGKTATSSDYTVAGASDFDTAMPWAGIQREILSTGDVMVKIPKFYYQRYREGDIEYIKIADRKRNGFTLHPLFNHNGVESDCAYVGAYKTSSDNKSVTGVLPQVSQTRATMRANAKSKGAGWGIIDISAVSAIQMLILVEFATNDSQTAIGWGACNNRYSAQTLGTCDNVPNLTGAPSGSNGVRDVVWRGIEGFWGNVYEWTDGINCQGGFYYVCNDPSKYADDTSTGYVQLTYTKAISSTSDYILSVGLDTGENNHIMLPWGVGGSSSTGYCDGCSAYTGNTWYAYARGGSWTGGKLIGLFTSDAGSGSAVKDERYGSRLLYIPQ